MSKSPTPLYQTIIKDIKENLVNGIYEEHDRIPTEEEFCTRYSTSRTTVRRALLELEQQNIIVSKQGSGYYVSSQHSNQSLQRFYSFSKEMRKQGKVPSNKIISFQTKDPDEYIRNKMQLHKNELVIHIERLRLADNQPYMYSNTYLPVQKFIGLSQSMVEKSDLYDVLTKRYKIIFSKAIESLYPILPEAQISSLLLIDTNIPCIHLTRVTYDLCDIIEFTESIVRGDKFEFSIELNN